MKISCKADSWLVSAKLTSSIKRYYLDGMAIDFLPENDMKAKAIIAGLVAVAAALATVYVVRKRGRKKVVPVQRTHHLTEVFSKAKSYAK